MRVSSEWKDYTCIDAGNGEKLEKWGDIVLRRPDPQAIWKTDKDEKWNQVDGRYYRSHKGGGEWKFYKKLPDYWVIHYKELTFKVTPTNFKHTGLFPEQATNWNLIRDVITKEKRPIKVLNLFAYTGAASVAALASGASVVHVDSSKGMVEWAKENVLVNHLQDRPIRFIVDDCLKFVKREIRRGNTYDIILMDPPSFGRGSKKEVWTIEEKLYELVNLCTELMSEKFVLFLINSYSTGLSKTVLENLLYLMVNKKKKGIISSDEIGIKMQDYPLVLPCGVTAIWQDKEY